MFNAIKVFITLLLFLTTALWASDEKMSSPIHRMPKIIGGQDTPAGKWPWMVSIHLAADKSSFCGGSLIHPYWVLTAAHCVDGLQLTDPPLKAEEIFVVIGLHQQSHFEQEGEQRQITRIIQHPYWNRLHLSWPFDIALLQLAEPSKQVPVNIPLKVPHRLTPEQSVIALGWGLTDAADDNSVADVLQTVELPVISNTTCQSAYLGEREISATMLCVGFADGKKDSCVGDSGGPLILFEEGQWQQVGIISYGGKKNGPRCGGVNAYGITTRVFEHLDFIEKQVPLPTVGAYDGIWISPQLPNQFVIVRNTTDTFALAFLDTAEQRWQALLGLTGYFNTTVSSLSSLPYTMIAEFKPNITPLPPINQATVEIITCQTAEETHPDNCFLPEGTLLSLKKLF